MEKKSILEELKSIHSKASECNGRLKELSSILKNLGDDMEEIGSLLSPSSSDFQQTRPTIRRKSGTMVGVYHPKPPPSADS